MYVELKHCNLKNCILILHILSLIYDNLSWFPLPFEILELVLSIFCLPSRVFYPPSLTLLVVDFLHFILKPFRGYLCTILLFLF